MQPNDEEFQYHMIRLRVMSLIQDGRLQAPRKPNVLALAVALVFVMQLCSTFGPAIARHL